MEEEYKTRMEVTGIKKDGKISYETKIEVSDSPERDSKLAELAKKGAKKILQDGEYNSYKITIEIR
ncbi:hypothetical protein J4411_03840 [Candidatus Pacearchaeota archaeon]|nr:hypothetical protein [Candidatus Pacearchaeota archaeon]